MRKRIFLCKLEVADGITTDTHLIETGLLQPLIAVRLCTFFLSLSTRKLLGNGADKVVSTANSIMLYDSKHIKMNNKLKMNRSISVLVTVAFCEKYIIKAR